MRRLGLVCLVLGSVLLGEQALAATGTGLPYEAGLTLWLNSMTGFWAYVVSLTALVLVFGTMAFGGEMTMIGRVGLGTLGTIGFIVLAVATISSMFGVGGALV